MRLIRLIKINLIWMFKYRCNIPDGVWFAGEYIPQGMPVYIANQRLHLLRVCRPNEHTHPFGIALTDDGLSVLEKGHFKMTHNFNPAYYDVCIDVAMHGFEDE